MSTAAMSNMEKQPNRIVRFFKRSVEIIKAYLMATGLMFTLGSILSFFLILNLASSGIGTTNSVEEVAEGKDFIIELAVQGAIRDKALNSSERLISQLFGEDAGLYLPEVSYVLREAAKDERVKGIILKLENSAGGLNSFVELHNLLMEFRKSEKPVRAFLSDSDTKDLIIASTANQIMMSSVAQMTIPGPALQLTYFGKALEKIGVKVEVIQSGKYKSAFEPFVQNAPSEASLEALQSVESNLRVTLAELIAKARNKKTEDVLSWLKKGMFHTDDAQFLNIVDRSGYYPEYKEEFIKETGVYDKSVSFTEYTNFVKSRTSESELPEKGIALIEAIGEIHLYNSANDTGVIEPNQITKEIRWAAKNEKVGAILIRVDSPGGSATASDLIWHEIENAKSKKPVVISMGSSAASGGYYISAPASYILSGSTTITGSIGVIGMVGNLAPFEDKYGVSFHTISGTERKSLLDPGTALTDADKALLEDSFKSTYKAFIKKVGKGRSKTPEEVDEIGQGRIWTGKQALEIGLVDEIGGFNKAIAKAKELAGLDPNEPAKLLRWHPEHSSFTQCFKATGDFMECLQLAGAKSYFGNHLLGIQLPEFLKGIGVSKGSIENWSKEMGKSAAYSPIRVSI